MGRTTILTLRQSPRAALAAIPGHLRGSGPDGRLQGRALAVVRGVWLAMAALTVGLYLVGVRLDVGRPYWP
jgi:hypothetical protein